MDQGAWVAHLWCKSSLDFLFSEEKSYRSFYSITLSVSANLKNNEVRIIGLALLDVSEDYLP
jgi:hypothetical protein